jgi:hypothetical protein
LCSGYRPEIKQRRGSSRIFEVFYAHRKSALFEGIMNAPESCPRLALAAKQLRSKKARRSKAFIAELRRQCKLIAAADRRDTGWQQLIHLPE